MMMVVAMLMKMMMKRERWLEVSYLLLLSATVDYDANSHRWNHQLLVGMMMHGGSGVDDDNEPVFGDGDDVDDDDE